MATELRQRKKTNKKTKKKDISSSSSSSETTNNNNNNNDAKKKKEKIIIENDNNNKDKDAVGDDDVTLWQTFSKHPLIQVTPFILIPLLLYNSIYYISLKQPSIISQLTFGLYTIRPAISLHESRQLLIIGSEIEYNQYVITGINKLLQLEISSTGAMDTEYYFTRDGTISWFPIIRYIKDPTYDYYDNNNNNNDDDNTNDQDNHDDDDTVITMKEKLLQKSSSKLSIPSHILKMQVWNQFCLNRTEQLISSMFHPKYYNYGSNCSGTTFLFQDTTKWSHCWTRECLNVIENEWGCAYNNNNMKKKKTTTTTIDDNNKNDITPFSSSSLSCTPTFNRVLHQVRHPLRTIEQLVLTYCPSDSINNKNSTTTTKTKDGNDDVNNNNNNNILQDTIPFIKLVSSLFNYRDDWNTISSCIDGIAIYVIEFHTTLLNAKDVGLIDDIFQFETTTPCQLASMGGFLDPTNSNNIYEPIYKNLLSLCYNEEGNEENQDSSSSSSSKEDNVKKEQAQSMDTFSRIEQHETAKKKKKDNNDEEEFSLTLQDFHYDLQMELQNLIEKLGY